MRKLMSTNYSAGAFNVAMLLLRLIVGMLIMKHGYDKLVHFSQYQSKFMNFMGIGQTASLALVVFAEFFCGLFLILGLFTRLASIPLFITMFVVIFKVTNWDVFGEGESATLYAMAFLTIMLLGPGKVSVDGMTGK
jgi:putative oxidoreductase